MKKEAIIIFALILFLFPIISANVDSEIQKITHYAEEYETGNINYVELLVYMSGARENMNIELGVVDKEHGGIVKEEQIRRVLGEPNEETKWVWVENEHHDVNLGRYIPVWKKLIFDGKKIQIWLNAFPMIFKKQGQEDLVYSINSEIWFKDKEQEIDFSEKVSYVKELAEEFNSNPSSANAETLAEQSVNVEMLFHDFFRQNQKQCVDIMKTIFGSENQRQTQKLLVHEIDFYSSDKAEVIVRLEMCEDCEWNYVNLDMRSEQRGGFLKDFEKDQENKEKTTGKVTGAVVEGGENSEEIKDETYWEEKDRLDKEKYANQEKDFESDFGIESCADDCKARCEDEECKSQCMEKCKESFSGEGENKEEFRNGKFEKPEREQRAVSKDPEQFKREIRELVERARQEAEAGNFRKIEEISRNIWEINEQWNKQSNDVWDSVKIDNVFQQNKEGEHDPYFWIKERKRQEEEVKRIQQANYEDRKQFYLSLFSDYEKREFYYEQTQFEKRLIQEFKEFGEEICDNNGDDNNNGQVDCQDEQCGGQFCGKTEVEIIDEETSETRIESKDLYCIQRTCQVKEEIIEKPKETVCGNHVCEENETIETCAEDCSNCPVHEPIECPEDGKVIFSGKDENNCSLNPICIEKKSCNKNEDCEFLCGIGECVFENEAETGTCEVVELTECKKPECNNGEEKVEKCDSGERIIIAICVEGLWEETNLGCEKFKPKIECAKCGNSCLSKEEIASVMCEQTTEDFECEVEGDKCVVVDKSKPKSEKVCCSDFGPADEPSYRWVNEDDCKSYEGSEFGLKIVDDSYCEEEKPEATCGDYCKDFMSRVDISCPGELEISGKYPDCSCDWICEESVGNECRVKEDCGGENDVCSNGHCVEIPEVIEVPIKEPIKKETPKQTESPTEPKPTETEKESEQENKEEIEEQQPEPEQEVEESPTTGEVIFGLFRVLAGKITGAITGLQTEESEAEQTTTTEISEPPPEPPKSESTSVSSEEPPTEEPTDGQPIGEGEKTYEEPENKDRNEDDRDYHEEQDRRERQENEKEDEERCGYECQRICKDKLIVPCVEDCVFDEETGRETGESLEQCEKQCGDEKGIGSCVSDCVNKCKKGGDWWKEYEDKGREEHKEEKGVFGVGGGCRKAQSRTEGFLYFMGWGDPFERIDRLKQKYYEKGDDWCERDLQNIIKQRKEFEQGFNQEFVRWFFEDYMANTAEDWEQHISGIFELYWKDVEMSMRMSEMLGCLEKNELPEYNLIGVEYETEYGKLEFWEELKEMKTENGKNVNVITPYMKIWIFPPKLFIIYEMKQAMKNHEFPGPPEEKMEREKQEGPTEEEKQMIKQDKKFMKKIRSVAEKYGGSLDGAVQFVDYETNEVVFNMYVSINENDIMKMEPMLPEEMPEIDVEIKIDFEKIYDMILSSEKDMKGAHIESPPWDRKAQPVQKVKEVVNGVKMWFKMREIMNSAEVSPKNAEGDAKDMFNTFFKMMVQGDKENRGPPGEEQNEEMEKQGGGGFKSFGQEGGNQMTGEVIGVKW